MESRPEMGSIGTCSLDTTNESLTYQSMLNESDLGSESSSDEGDGPREPLLQPKKRYDAIPTAHTDNHNAGKAFNDSGNQEKSGSIISSVFTLVSTMIGGGLLSLPFAFKEGGFGFASFVLVFVLMASTYGGFLIINSKKYCRGKIRNIEDVAKVAFGSNGQVRLDVLILK